MQSSRCDKKTLIGQHQDSKDVTLRKVINSLNATNTKNASTSSDKAIMQDFASRSLKERIKSNYAFSNKADAMKTSIKMMRKELREQVKRNKANPKSTNRRDHSSKRHINLSSYWYPVSEVSWPETTGPAAPTPSRLSSAVESQQSVKQSEALSGKDVKWETDSLLSRHSDAESCTNLVNQNKNIYSRHLQSNSAEIEEEEVCFEAESPEKDKASQEYRHRDRRRLSNAWSVQSFSSDLSKQAFTSTTKTSRNRSASQSSQDDEGTEKVTSRNNPKEKIQDEREFVEALTDPTLKTSLQRIIQKRRNSICLVKSITGLRVVNDDETFSVIAEEKSDLDLESLMAKSDSKISVVSGRTTNKSGSISGQKIECGSRNDGYAASEWEIKSLKNLHSEASHRSFYQSNNQFDNPRTSLAYSRTVSTRKKGVTNSGKKCSLWPDKNVRTNKVEIEETRIIKPLSSKTYRPCLTATSRAKKRSNTARSSPETSQEKSHCVKEKEDVIREFMLMYAKVKQNKKEVESAVEENKPVRMISATPEFVVKSAIGQFLSGVFPPERPRDSSWAREERQEDKQRTKLLKIKICMQQLASIA